MHTILELIKEMSHSTIQGFFGVLGIFALFTALIGAGICRVKEQLQKENHH